MLYWVYCGVGCSVYGVSVVVVVLYECVGHDAKIGVYVCVVKWLVALYVFFVLVLPPGVHWVSVKRYRRRAALLVPRWWCVPWVIVFLNGMTRCYCRPWYRFHSLKGGGHGRFSKPWLGGPPVVMCVR